MLDVANKFPEAFSNLAEVLKILIKKRVFRVGEEVRGCQKKSDNSGEEGLQNTKSSWDSLLVIFFAHLPCTNPFCSWQIEG